MRITVFSSITTLALALTSACSPLKEVEGTVERTLPVDGHVELTVETGSGDILVERGEADEVYIETRVSAGALDKTRAEALLEEVLSDPPIEASGNVIRVGDTSRYTDRAFDKLVVSFTLHVPEDTEIVADSGSGTQYLAGFDGPVNTSVGSGEVVAEDILLDVTASAGAGSVTLSRIGGDVNAEAGSGGVRVGDVGGSLNAHTGSGPITVASAVAAGAVWKVEAGSGDVSVALPEDESFEIHAETGSGALNIEFPVSGGIGDDALDGTVGDAPDAELRLSTGSGDIDVTVR